jgi:hypothetical protein
MSNNVLDKAIQIQKSGFISEHLKYEFRILVNRWLRICYVGYIAITSRLQMFMQIQAFINTTKDAIIQKGDEK